MGRNLLNLGNLLRFSAFAVFAGRAWQHLVWDAPIRVLFWDERLMKPLIEGVLGIRWSDYATGEGYNAVLDGITRSFGLFYLLCALVTLLPEPQLRRFSKILLAGSVSLAFLSFLYFKEKYLFVGEYAEYAIQVAAPAFLYAYANRLLSLPRLDLFMKVAIALTFTGHGLYAVGYYPTPGMFLDMTIGILRVSEPVAQGFLMTAGILDFLVAILIFVPRVAPMALAYGALWGLLTAMARVVAYFDMHLPLASLNQWLFETLIRLPHAALPLACLLIALGSRASGRVCSTAG